MAAVKQEPPKKAASAGPTIVPLKVLANLRKAMQEERDMLRRQVAGLEQEIKELHESGAEENGFGSHPADVSGDTYMEETEVSLLENTQRTLGLIEQALERMGRGTYGLCVDCGAAIPLERLQARPYAARCVSCQATFDRKQHTKTSG
ncbi:MAG: TraR/DksA C4-type zinc finger protein [Chloroflexota bacterium]